jgi:Zeta toxin
MTSSALIPPEEFLAADWAREHDNPAITAEIVIAELSDDERNKLQDAKCKLQGLLTTAELFKHGNDYSEERKRRHREIIEHFLSAEHVRAATPDAQEAPTFAMLGGRGGSGKSWFANEVYSRRRCIALDADEIKKMLPEYEGWKRCGSSRGI